MLMARVIHPHQEVSHLQMGMYAYYSLFKFVIHSDLINWLSRLICLFYLLIVPFYSSDKEKERQVTIHDKYLLSGLKALCRGSGALHRPDQVSLVSAMKAAKLPPHIKTSSPGRAGREILGVLFYLTL